MPKEIPQLLLVAALMTTEVLVCAQLPPQFSIQSGTSCPVGMQFATTQQVQDNTDTICNLMPPGASVQVDAIGSGVTSFAGQCTYQANLCGPALCTQCACIPGGSVVPGGGGSSGGAGKGGAAAAGTRGWAVFVLLLVFVGLPLYVGVGVAIKVKGQGEALTVEAVPNLQFW